LTNPSAISILVITILTSFAAFYINPQWITLLALKPYDIFHHKRYYTMVTSGFVHANMSHLLFNMLTFYFFAFRLEKIIGSVPVLILYFLSLIISDLPTVIKQKENQQYASLGASGAVSAVVFSFILFFPLSKIYIMFIPIGIPAFLYAILYLLYCIYASRNNQDNINHDAHFYGALCGVVLTLLIKPVVIENIISLFR
jgi:membrane associated rhomboid family serine protease